MAVSRSNSSRPKSPNTKTIKIPESAMEVFNRENPQRSPADHPEIINIIKYGRAHQYSWSSIHRAVLAAGYQFGKDTLRAFSYRVLAEYENEESKRRDHEETLIYAKNAMGDIKKEVRRKRGKVWK